MKTRFTLITHLLAAGLTGGASKARACYRATIMEPMPFIGHSPDPAGQTP